MKTTEISRIPGVRLVLLAALTLPFSPSTAAEDAGRTGAYRTSVAQEQLRVQTKRTRLEIVRMIEEFKRFSSAAPEIAMAEEALKKLESIGEKEMTEVIQTLREANRTENDEEAKRMMLQASNTQKEIQVTLRALADKLSILQAEASMEQRVKGLMMRQMANTRDIQSMADGTTKDWDIPKQLPVAASEQEAIQKEVSQLNEVLKQVSGKQSLASAKFASEEAKLQEHADAAAAAVAAKDFGKALEEQKKVTEALDKMMTGLNSEKSVEERAQEAVSKLNELSSLQKELARTTTSSSFGQQAVVKTRQEKIADEVAALKSEVAQLNPEAAQKLGESRQTMDQIDSALKKDRSFITDAANKLGIVNAQKDAAGDLEAAAKALEPLTGESGLAENGSDPNAEVRSAIEAAAADVIEAQSQINMANSILSRGGDPESARQQMDAAKSSLADAMENAEKAGGAVPGEVQKDLQNADGDLAGSKEKSGGGDQERSRWGLNDAGKNAAKALAGLRAASSKLAAGQGQASAGMGKSGDSSGASAASGGAPGNTQHEATSVDATSQASNSERMALSLLQREKASPEYNGMVQQYLKNLAAGEMPVE